MKYTYAAILFVPPLSSIRNEEIPDYVPTYQVGLIGFSDKEYDIRWDERTWARLSMLSDYAPASIMEVSERTIRMAIQRLTIDGLSIVDSFLAVLRTGFPLSVTFAWPQDIDSDLSFEEDFSRRFASSFVWKNERSSVGNPALDADEETQKELADALAACSDFEVELLEAS